MLPIAFWYMFDTKYPLYINEQTIIYTNLEIMKHYTICYVNYFTTDVNYVYFNTTKDVFNWVYSGKVRKGNAKTTLRNGKWGQMGTIKVDKTHLQ